MNATLTGTQETLRRWQQDSVAFAAEVLNFPLWPHQIEVIRSPKPFKVIVAARQTGKSALVAVEALHTAFAKPGSTSLILSATEDAAKRMIATIKDLMDSAPLLGGSVIDSHKSRIALSNGSEIISLPASEKQIRGYTTTGVLILDEAAFMPEELWRAAFYTIAAVPNPKVYLCSSPWGSADHFFRRLWIEGQDRKNPDYASFQWSYKVSPKINKALLERERERTDPLTYKAEVLGEWVDDADSYFTYDEVMNAVADYPLLPPEDARGECAMGGVDYGMRFDSNALVLVSPLAPWVAGHSDNTVYYIVPWLEEHPAGSTDYASFVKRVADTSLQLGKWRLGQRKGTGYHYQALITETNGVGAMPSQELAKLMGATVRDELTYGGWNYEVVIPTATTSAYKRDAYGRLKMLLQQGRLILPRHPGLMKQLTHLRYQITQTGHLTIDTSSPAIHDDLVDALAHAVQATVKAEKRPRWSFHQRPKVAEWIETPHGIRLPKPIRAALPVIRRE